MPERDVIKGFGYRRKSAGFDISKLESALRDGYMTKARKPVVTKKTTFSPSSLGYESGTCARRWVLAFRGEDIFEDSVDAVGIANMQSGTDAHTRIQKALADSGILKKEEVEVKSVNPPIRGFVDVIVDIDGEEVVGEVKTTRQEAFMYREQSMKGAPYHMYQILIYMWILDKKNGFLLYENRNDNTALVIPVAMNDVNKAKLNTALDWMRRVYSAYEDGELPTRPWTRRNKICKACPLFTACWDKYGEGNVVIPPMEVEKF
jgi:CRISPR/Cas system-associated exonuclease Cas4 (RecB family)